MPVQGLFEAIERNGKAGWVAKGWAFDPDAPDEAVRLALMCEEGPLGDFLAEQPRPDLAASSHGNGRHGFVVKLPSRLLDGRPHVVQIAVVKEQRLLPQKPGPIFFPSPLYGQVNAVVHGALHGWALDEHALHRPPVIAVEVDGKRITSLTGDLPRPDLAAVIGGDGRHGFCFPLPETMFDGRPHSVTVCFANTAQHLDGSPLDVTLPTALATTRRRRLELKAEEQRAALEDTRLALAREPLNRLADPAVYRHWLQHHEAAIAAQAGSDTTAGRIAVLSVPDGPAAGFAAAVAASDADAVVFREPGARLHPALLPLAEAALAEGADIVYCDEDDIHPDGERGRPRFKPDWDPDRHLAFPYPGLACVLARRCLDEAAALVARTERPADALSWAAAVVDTALLSAPPGRIRHLPFVLHHRVPTDGDGGTSLALPGRADRVRAHLARAWSAGAGPSATVEADQRGRLRVCWALPQPAPRVTLIVPTRDRVKLLRACLDSVLSKTRYSRYDIVVIDNDSRDGETLSYLEDLDGRPGIWVRRWPGPFNYAAMHNAVAREIDAPYMALLNNDIEVITPDWLEEMMGHAARPDVGAVGAKLLYPDGMIQHGGVLVGQNGAADHALRIFGGEEDGYLHGAMIAQNVSAVTAACMVCRREDYLAVGGMDAENLAVAFNDVDLCLKLRALGRRIVWTPHALLLHHESATRAGAPEMLAHERREVEYLRARWGTGSFSDPFYSPNLSRGLQTHVDFNWEAAKGRPDATPATT
jgi:GT2 family glycosyltransferase